MRYERIEEMLLTILNKCILVGLQRIVRSLARRMKIVDEEAQVAMGDWICVKG